MTTHNRNGFNAYGPSSAFALRQSDRLATKSARIHADKATYNESVKYAVISHSRANVLANRNIEIAKRSARIAERERINNQLHRRIIRAITFNLVF